MNVCDVIVCVYRSTLHTLFQYDHVSHTRAWFYPYMWIACTRENMCHNSVERYVTVTVTVTVTMFCWVESSMPACERAWNRPTFMCHVLVTLPALGTHEAIFSPEFAFAILFQVISGTDVFLLCLIKAVHNKTSQIVFRKAPHAVRLCGFARNYFTIISIIYRFMTPVRNFFRVWVRLIPLGRVGLDLVNFEKKNDSDRPFDVFSPPWLCNLRSEWNVGTGQSPGWLIWTQHVPEDSLTHMAGKCVWRDRLQPFYDFDLLWSTLLLGTWKDSDTLVGDTDNFLQS